MQSSSRRAFLMGRRSSQTPWEIFCRRVRSAVKGSFYDFGTADGFGSARLTPKAAADVRSAQALCTEYGVVFALEGVPNVARLDDSPVLWVEPGIDMAKCERLPGSDTRWFVQPGCLLGELETAGLQQFTDLPYHITVGAWMADRALCDWDPGETYRSGIECVSILLADGSSGVLGPFGDSDSKPLDNLTLQRLVPSLFQIAGRTETQTCRELAHWPARYRLDALLPTPGHSVNLSHLLLGHGGDLGWVEWIVLNEQPRGELPGSMPRFARTETPDNPIEVLAADLDSRVKFLFDPSGAFPHPGQDFNAS